MPDEAVQLDYAPPPPGTVRPRLRRWLVIALVGVAALAAARFLPDAASRVRFRVLQARCATFAYPPDAVIYDSDPAARSALLADSSNYVAVDDTSIWIAPAVIRREPGAWSSLKTALFGNRNFWPPGPPTPKAMVHRLRNADGRERIVAIVLAPDLPGRPMLGTGEDPAAVTGSTLGLVAAVVRPGDWENPPRWEGNGTFLHGPFDPTRRLRFYAAQLDPQNPAKFSIRYEMDGQAGTIDGTFQTDGDVVMTVRDGPAKAAPATPPAGAAP